MLDLIKTKTGLLMVMKEWNSNEGRSTYRIHMFKNGWGKFVFLCGKGYCLRTIIISGSIIVNMQFLRFWSTHSMIWRVNSSVKYGIMQELDALKSSYDYNIKFTEQLSSILYH